MFVKYFQQNLSKNVRHRHVTSRLHESAARVTLVTIVKLLINESVLFLTVTDSQIVPVAGWMV